MFTALAFLASLTATPTTVPAVLAAAQPGDTVVLSTGVYPGVTLKKKTWTPAITVDATKATLPWLVLQDVQGFYINGGSLVAPGPNGYNVNIIRGKDIRVRGMALSGAVRGIVATGEDFVFSHNVITGQRTDGIDVPGSQRVLIAYNKFSDFSPVPADHPDAIQAWPVAGRPDVSDITIIGNEINGNMQGIGMYGSGPYRRIYVANNTIRNLWGQGIGLYGAVDSIVINNDLQSLAPGKVKSSINLPKAVNVLACGNRVADVSWNPANKGC